MNMKILGATIVGILGIINYGDACTGITLHARDKSTVVARTVDWHGDEMNNMYVIAPRGHTQTSLSPDGKMDGMRFTSVYANNDSTDVHPFFYEDEAKGLTLESMLAMTNDWDYRHGNGTLIDYMLKETDYFHVSVPFTLDEAGDIKIGFRVELPKLGGQMPFVDYFHLLYYGNQEIPTEETTAIKEVAEKTAATQSGAIYNLAGQRVGEDYKGIVIKNGKKVLVK